MITFRISKKAKNNKLTSNAGNKNKLNTKELNLSSIARYITLKNFVFIHVVNTGLMCSRS